MTTTQSGSGAGTPKDYRNPSQASDAFTNEGGGQSRGPITPEFPGLRHDAEQAVRSAKDTLVSVRDMAGDVYEGARKSATNAAGSLNDVVVHNPWASVGVAAGVGLLFGLLLGGLRR